MAKKLTKMAKAEIRHIKIYTALKQKAELLMLNPRFNELCQNFKNIWGTKNWWEARKPGDDRYQVKKEYEKDLANIRREFELGPEWEFGILGYIFSEERIFPPPARYRLSFDPDTYKVILELGPYTTLEDIEVTKSIIDEWKTSVFGKDRTSMRVIKNLIRDEKIFYLHQQGLSYKDISIKLDSSLSYDDVGKACRRYEKRLNISK
ncbi:MAG: hypothetical protein WC890_04240 [Candidatus Margulisiibacteriota bacterium]